jgi:nicotinamidase/pyrazinamidase
MKNSALIIIDLQNDFCPGGALQVPEGDQTVTPLNRIMDDFDIIVATQDWHPGGHISFASSHSEKEPFDTVQLDGIDQILWPDHCVQGSKGAAFHPELRSDPIKLIIRKGWNPNIDSYSAFKENDGITLTGLEGYLKTLHINQLFIGGLALDVCVLYSVIDALELGFSVKLLEDACRGIDTPPGSVKKAIDKMKENGASIIRTRDL